MILANLLSSSSYIITNKFLIKALGTDAAILIGELCSEYNYWEQKDGLKDDERFFSTRENIEDNTYKDDEVSIWMFGYCSTNYKHIQLNGITLIK